MVDEGAVAKDFVRLPESETDREESHGSPVFLLPLHSHPLSLSLSRRKLPGDWNFRVLEVFAAAERLTPISGKEGKMTYLFGSV